MSVAGLRESLERLQGVTAGQSVSDVFDTELSHLVMDFNASTGSRSTASPASRLKSCSQALSQHRIHPS